MSILFKKRNTVATFEKVSFNEFKKTWFKLNKTSSNDGKSGNLEIDALKKILEIDALKKIYDEIILPSRSTDGSAGYDFHAPVDIKLSTKGEHVIIPTGIKCKMKPGFVLKCYPRSGQGFKSRLFIANTVPIIDQDYYNNKNNEGHIMIEIVYDGFDICKKRVFKFSDTTESHLYLTKSDEIEEVPVHIERGKGFVQGVIERFYYASEKKDIKKIRNGGLGSTDK